jgi:hypothetical protein
MGIDSCLCGTGSQPLFKAVGRFNEMTANTGSTVLILGAHSQCKGKEMDDFLYKICHFPTTGKG